VKVDSRFGYTTIRAFITKEAFVTWDPDEFNVKKIESKKKVISVTAECNRCAWGGVCGGICDGGYATVWLSDKKMSLIPSCSALNPVLKCSQNLSLNPMLSLKMSQAVLQTMVNLFPTVPP